MFTFIEQPRMLQCLRWAIVGLLVLGVPSAEGASLQVVAAAAHSGSYGLRVTLGSACTGVDDVELDNQTLSGPATIVACRTLTATATTVSAGEVALEAGERVALGSGFSVSSGASLVVGIDPALTGTAYVADSTFSGDHYGAGFFLRADNIVWDIFERFEVLRLASWDGTMWASFVLKRNAILDENRLVLDARDDSGIIRSTELFTEVVFPQGWSWVSLDFKAGKNGHQGHLYLYLNDQMVSGLYFLDNYAAQVDRVLLGAQGAGSAVSGSFDIDEFVSRAGGPIEIP